MTQSLVFKFFSVFNILPTCDSPTSPKVADCHTHPSIPSSSSCPFAISSSSFASRARITFGGSYSTASYSTSL